MLNKSTVQELFDAEGKPLGAILTAEIWAQVRTLVLQAAGSGAAGDPLPAPADRPEPIDDWEDLVRFWDFPYPVDTDVACTCGNATDNWRQDDPRKFRLTAANLGGLVTFRCLSCESKIMKRHFKDRVTVEVKPFVPVKSARNLGRPDHPEGD
jgi:hypothetical protein